MSADKGTVAYMFYCHLRWLATAAEEEGQAELARVYARAANHWNAHWNLRQATIDLTQPLKDQY